MYPGQIHVFVVSAYMLQVGSPIAFADYSTERHLRQVSEGGDHGLYIPSGALWGGEDIRRMADRGTLKVNVISVHIHTYHGQVETITQGSENHNEETSSQFPLGRRTCSEECYGH